ncbi:HEAT repeat domain-containing protein [Maribacter aurantiacus]|uniref:HEAT repeat domain-containing protein n=1 Tax=Maribacter aurantiacus TaxID=1882343 RepID=A0A5R8M2Y5_9FLAO|nr:HEAT repeat domain-containing protein [Maribacter aurantiacus]TLF43976.1 hypothetical protein FEK29_12935 [Maribacter aurantiacus]
MITSPKIPTDLLWGLSSFFIGLAVVYLISVFYFRNRITREAQKIRKKKKELSPIVSEFLFYDENGDKIEKINYIGLKIEVRELIKSPFDRKVLTEILMDLRKDVSGSTRTELFHIYQDLGLHEDAYKKLRSWRWEDIAKGIFELTQMHVEEAYMPITRFINDRRPTVRKQAEIAVVTLKREGVTFFLDHTKYKISEWQQLKLLDVVRNKEDYLAPPFRLWLTSKNNYVVLFALRLIKHYNQNDASSSLITLVHHKSDHIKREAIHCIKEFNITEALPVLKSVFDRNSTDIRMHILDTVAEIGSEADLPFLEDIEGQNYSFMVKNKAVRAINTIKPEAILPTKDIEKVTEPKVPENAVDQMEADETEHEFQSETMTSKAQNPELLTSHPKFMDEEILNANEVSLDAQTWESSIEEIEEEETQTLDLTGSLELTEDEIAFLPLVIDSDREGFANVSEEKEISLDDLPVIFEELKTKATPIAFDCSFLPLVVERREQAFKDPLQIRVDFEEVLGVQKSEPVSVSSLNVDYEEVLVKPKAEPVRPESMDVAYEEIRASRADAHIDEFQLDLLDFSDMNSSEDTVGKNSVAFPDAEENSMEWPLDFEWESQENESQDAEITPEEEILETVFSLEHLIPKPKYYEDMETMALLENIEELGDEREIPFLKSLLESETSPAVLERVGTILDHFIATYSTQTDFENTEPLKEYSVFEELIFKGDLETKLFLLNEIAEVGDAKELPLLHTLVSHANKGIRETALKVLHRLQSRLQEASVDPVIRKEDAPLSIEQLLNQDNSDFFELNFEPAGTGEGSTERKYTRSSNTGDRNTLFDHLCNMSTKFYNKKNG